MATINAASRGTLPKDLIAGTVVFLVALPLCLGIALASNAPLISGLLAGIIGGIVVGAISKSQTSVSGPAAGLTAVVSAQIAALGSFDAFLAAVAIAGVIQIGLGVAKAGFLADFIPSSVIKGLLAAIGVLLILKQIPHLLGHDSDPEGSMEFIQPDNRNTFTEFLDLADDFQWGAALIGLSSLALLILWSRWKLLKKSIIPGPLVVVIVGVAAKEFLETRGVPWAIEPSHLVQVPVTETWNDILGLATHLDVAAFGRFAVWQAGVVLALVASLETLLNLEAVDKVDPYGRNSHPSRELIAQGVGNMVASLVGAIPVTSVIVRSSVNISAGGRTQLSTVVHGILLAATIALIPTWINRIPLSCLAAILIITGFKLTSPRVVRSMWTKGVNQFVPFAFTVVAIVLTNLLAGVIAGLVVAIGFILMSNVRRPIRRIVEKHAAGEVLRIELANQVSFLNRAAIAQTLESVPRGGHLLIDASGTDYVDPDILDLIHDFETKSAPSRNIHVSLKGFHERYQMSDRIEFVDFSTRELQRAITPSQVLQLLRDGNERFRSGQRLRRDLGRQLEATSTGQFPLAAILSCMDSRAPVELLFDLGLGDIFSIRIAGNVASRKVIGSLELACAVAGSKLIVVLGHSRCGAVTAAVENARSGMNLKETTGCEHFARLVDDLRQSIKGIAVNDTNESFQSLVEEVVRRNILRSIQTIRSGSPVLAGLERSGQIAIAGAKYDIASGRVEFLPFSETAPLLENPKPFDLPAASATTI